MKEDDIPYVGCITPDGRILIWNHLTQQRCIVSGITDNYFSTNDKDGGPLSVEDFKVISIDNITILVNRKRKVAASSTQTTGTITKTVTTVADLPETAG